MKLSSTFFFFFSSLITGSNANCHGDCKIQCNPGNVAGYCNVECIGHCMAYRCPGYDVSNPRHKTWPQQHSIGE